MPIMSAKICTPLSSARSGLGMSGDASRSQRLRASPQTDFIYDLAIRQLPLASLLRVGNA